MRAFAALVALGLWMTQAFAGPYTAIDKTTLPEEKQSTLAPYLSAPEAYKMGLGGDAKYLLVDIRTKGEFLYLGTTTVADINIPYMEIDDPTSWGRKKFPLHDVSELRLCRRDGRPA